MIFAPRDLAVSLADGLVDVGHEVHFFASPDIQTKAHLIGGDPWLLEEKGYEEKMKGLPSERKKWASFYMRKRDFEMDLTTKVYEMATQGKLDVVHSYHDTMAHFFNQMSSFPTVYTLHDPLPQHESLEYWLLHKFSRHNYVSISEAFRKNSHLQLNFVNTVYHGIPVSEYKASPTLGDYLICIGRMVPEKGIHTAIDLAEHVNLPLKIATSSAAENEFNVYYQNEIAPRVKENKNITFTGYLTGGAKVDFLAGAKALIFPIGWEEPFGMVMIEALACGTPVIAYNRGSVAEIIEDGVTGFVIDPDDMDRPGKGGWVIKKQGIEGLAEAVGRLGAIDRNKCRERVEKKFSVSQMVAGYERVYKQVTSNK